MKKPCKKSPWRSMKTAPKDGRRILVHDGVTVHGVSWHKDEQTWNINAYFRCTRPQFWMPEPKLSKWQKDSISEPIPRRVA